MNRSHNPMLMLNIIWLFFVVPIAVAQEKGTGKKEPAKPKFEWESIQGTWLVTGYEQDGKENTSADPGDYWKFGQCEARQWCRNDTESQLYPMWRNDEKSKPRRLDLFTIDVGRGEALGRSGVYELRDDALYLTYSQGFGDSGPRATPTIDRENKITMSPRPPS